MKPRRVVGIRLVSIVMGLGALAGISRLASSEDYAGPLLPHVGLQVTTAFSNHFGADAESTVTFTAVTADAVSLNYTSTRGLAVPRSIRVTDRQNAKTYVLGYAAGMPLVIPDTTSLGISGATLQELRTTGKAPLALIYDAKMSRIDGELTLVAKDIKVPLILENQVVEVPAIHATGTFVAGGKHGDFYFLDNQNNPLMIGSTLQFSWEKQSRAERITRVTAGESMRSAMEQSLNTLRRYDLYGIHFDFDKATLRADSTELIKEIALTLKSNPTWTCLLYTSPSPRDRS